MGNIVVLIQANYQKDRMKSEGAYSVWKKLTTDGRQTARYRISSADHISSRANNLKNRAHNRLPLYLPLHATKKLKDIIFPRYILAIGSKYKCLDEHHLNSISLTFNVGFDEYHTVRGYVGETETMVSKDAVADPHFGYTITTTTTTTSLRLFHFITGTCLISVSERSIIICHKNTYHLAWTATSMTYSDDDLGPLLLTSINFNISMDKWLQPLWSVE